MKKKYYNPFYIALIVLIIALIVFLFINSETIQPDSCSHLRGIRKDNCYIDLVLEGDFTICEKISNEYTKNSCMALRESGKAYEDISQDVIPQPIKP